MNNLQKQYQEQIVPALQKELGIKNKLAIPRVAKIVVNSSSRDFGHDKDFLANTQEWLGLITGQTPSVRRAKTSIAGFNLHEGDIVGLTVTLRGVRMYDFLDKLINIVLPQTKDFQGVSRKSFDSQGNYTLGLREQIIFPEVEYDKIRRIHGLEISINTTAHNKDEAVKLLSGLGMPFVKE